MTSKTSLHRPEDVRARYGGVSDMTLRRWEKDPRVGFPSPIRINGRRFWDAALLDAFDERLAAREAAA
ncbi:MAG: hypothetical protein WEC00_13525 [Dongiaceae bacterium]